MKRSSSRRGSKGSMVGRSTSKRTEMDQRAGASALGRMTSGRSHLSNKEYGYDERVARDGYGPPQSAGPRKWFQRSHEACVVRDSTVPQARRRPRPRPVVQTWARPPCVLLHRGSDSNVSRKCEIMQASGQQEANTVFSRTFNSPKSSCIAEYTKRGAGTRIPSSHEWLATRRHACL